MSTTGARLAQRSKLASGTALAHLLALRDGLGTRFASEIRLATSQEELRVSEVRGENFSFPLTPERVGGYQADRVAVFTAPKSQGVCTVADRLTVTQRLKQDLFIHTL